MATTEKNTARFEKALYANIPIAEEMGARALEVSGTTVVLSAPLGPNTNHANTAFGGSVYAIAVLSCWALVSETVRLAGLESEYIVVQDGSINYLLPVESDFTAESVWPSSADRDKFLSMLRSKGLARATLSSQVKAGGQLRAKLRARFVAHLVSRPSKT